MQVGNRAIRRAPESNMYVCDVDNSDRKAYQCGRITCTLLRNKTKWRLTFSLQQIVIVKALD